MHELSIAKAILQLAERFRPADAHVQAVHVQAGPLQAIEPASLQWAWCAARKMSGFCDAELVVEQLPWRLKCHDCGRSWSAGSLEEACGCGSTASTLQGGDELMLTHLEVADDTERREP